MPEYFRAVGFAPRPPSEEEQWRQRLERWLRRTVQRGEFNRRRQMPEFLILRTADRHHEQKLWNFMAMGNVLESRGYVGLLRMVRSFQPDPYEASTVEEVIVIWEAVRCLPENEADLRRWNYTPSSRTEAEVHLGYNRQYNLTLRDRLLRGYTPKYAHRDAVGAIDEQGRQLLWRSVSELVVSAASASADLGPAGSTSGLGTIPGGHRHIERMGPLEQ